jgi:hypothetical protein
VYSGAFALHRPRTRRVSGASAGGKNTPQTAFLDKQTTESQKAPEDSVFPRCGLTQIL